MSQINELNIKRMFVPQNSQAYDQIKWVKKDSLLVNPASSKPVFEQKNVEFPEDWSLNAINIVSQKYFNGTPGTASRESSLKHLINRVVDTITNYGKNEGYFENNLEKSPDK